MSNYSSGLGSGIGAGLSLGIGSGIGSAVTGQAPKNNASAESQGPILADEEDGEEYVPNEKEVYGYAEFLGMDPVVDKDYLYIAVEGLRAPVPKPW